MKSLSAYNTTAIDNVNTEPIYLFKIEFSGLTLYLCDRVWGTAGSENVFDGQLYEPLILSWNTIECGKIDPVTYEVEPSKAQLVVDNTVPVGGANNFTALFSTYDPHYATVTVSLIFRGTVSSADRIDLFKGKIEDLLNMTQESITVECSGYELDIANRFSHTIIDTATFPGADPDEVGKMLPQVYGSCKKVPLLAIDVGSVTTLSADITQTATTINLSDASDFATTGTILVDSEQITYTGKSTNQLTGCTRGTSSTIAVTHNKGAMVGEIQSEFVYAIGHPVKAIDAVYVNNVKQDTGFTAYTGQTGDEHGIYAGRGVVSFPSWPNIQRSIDVSTQEASYREATQNNIGRVKMLDRNGYILDYDETTTITFQSTPTGTISDIFVEYIFEFRHFGTPTGQCDFKLDGTLIATWRDEVFTQFVSSPFRVRKAAWPATAIKSKTYRDGGMMGTAFVVLSARVYYKSTISEYTQRGAIVSYDSTVVPLGKFTSELTIDEATAITFPAAPAGTLSDIKIEYSWDFEFWGSTIFKGTPHHLTVDGINVAHVDGDGTVTELMPSTFTILKATWATSVTKTRSRLSEFRRGESLTVRSATQSCYSDDLSLNATIGGSSVADTVIGGLVAADIQGFQDDGAGTYTGMPSALIERPDHILKHIIIDRCGLTASEIDTTSYTAAGTFYVTESYVLGVAVLQFPNVRMLLNRIANQSKSIEFWEAGKHHLVHIPTTETTDKTLDEDRINLNQVWIKYTPRVNIKNTLSATYARDWSGYSDNDAGDKSVVVSTNSGSVTIYGTLEGDTLSYPYITAAAQAQAVLDLTATDWGLPRLIIELVGGYYLTDIERGDIIQLAMGLDADTVFFDTLDLWESSSGTEWHKELIISKLKTVLLGLTTSAYQFRVIDKIYRADQQQQIQLIKI